MKNDSGLIKKFSFFFLISFVIAVMDGYYQYFFGHNIFGINSLNISRMTLLLNDDMILGGYLARLFPLLIGILIYNFQKNFSNLLLCAILLILTDTLIFISGERTALGLLFISTVMIVILVSQFKVFRSITFIFSLIIISIIAISDTKIRERNIDHTINQLGLANDKDEIILFSPVHDSMFRSAWKMFNDSPLFGIGPNNFRIVCEYEDYRINDDTCNTHPHNTFFQIIAETGLFGLMFFLIGFAYLMIIILRQFYSILFKKNSYIDDVQVCIISCMFLSLWAFLPTQDFFNNWINVIYFLPLGFYLFFKNEKNDF